jgi:cell division protein FtsZ
MGIGSARGEDRAVVAAEHAISSPLLEASMDGAQGVLMNISGGSDLGLFEINAAAELVAEAAHPEANIIFGTVIDDALGDEVRITVIAAGFDGVPERRTGRNSSVRRAGYDRQREAVPPPVTPPPPPAPERSRQAEPEPVIDLDRAATSAPASAAGASAAPRPPVRNDSPPPRRTVVFDDLDDLDVPDFLK